MRSSKWALLAILLAGATANIAVTWQRTTIPLKLSGVVSDIDIRHEKHPGIDDIYLVTIEGRRYHVDRTIGKRLSAGTEVSKSKWSRLLATSDGPLHLRPSADATAMLVTMPLLVAVGIFLIRRGFSGTRAPSLHRHASILGRGDQ